MSRILSTGGRIVARILRAEPADAKRYLAELENLGITEEHFLEGPPRERYLETIASMLFRALKEHYGTSDDAPTPLSLLTTYEKTRKKSPTAAEIDACLRLFEAVEGYRDDEELPKLCESLRADSDQPQEFTVTAWEWELLHAADFWANEYSSVYGVLAGVGQAPSREDEYNAAPAESRLDYLASVVGEGKVAYRRAIADERHYQAGIGLVQSQERVSGLWEAVSALDYPGWRAQTRWQLQFCGGEMTVNYYGHRGWEKLKKEGLVDEVGGNSLDKWTYRLTAAGREAAFGGRSLRTGNAGPTITADTDSPGSDAS